MCTSKFLGAVCTAAILLSAGCSPIKEISATSPSAERVTAAAWVPHAGLATQGDDLLTVTFAFDRDTLDEVARHKLDAQAAWMAEHPELRFSATGHADKVGDPAYNLDLGLRRAQRVVEYLVAAGIARQRLEALVSQGEEQPVVNSDAPERLNRRVVIRIAGVVRGTSSASDTPWWHNQRRPHRFDPDDGSNRTRSFRGSPLVSTAGPALANQGANETVSTSAPDTIQGEQARDGANQPSGTTSPASPAGSPSDTASSNTSGSGQQTGREQSAQSSEPASEPATNGQPGGGRGPHDKDKSAQSASAQSSDHTNAGRGNGAEDGDPGKSGGKNQGGDAD